ncbi:MAG: hypothetical protein CVV28_11790 [Methanobacteriales archaeon HGW-Methanobacteriales-1]|jgi:flavorubredoxin|nr:MAG: hypothetical protein CVV28_11790 [Methanobacteriales archaeon HGW-Methanobacteriales-1]
MNTKKIAKIAGISLAIILISLFSVMGVIIYDVMSYTANGFETFSAEGNVTGNALVVYAPGISGQSSNAALNIAKELQNKGYNVDLVGINNAKAKNTSIYELIIVGGPIYAGKASSSVQAYLNNLKPSKGTKIAVFATGSDKDVMKNSKLLRSEVAPLNNSNSFKIDAVGKFVSGENNNHGIVAFVGSFI